jgi:4-hydroxy-3-methylbut-2-enyl diphosphate reductase
VVLVIGSKNSSNSNRLREVAERAGCQAHLIDGPADIDPAWLEGSGHIGVTAGASAPELLVQQVVDFLRARGATNVERLAVTEENVIFNLPEELRIHPVTEG